MVTLASITFSAPNAGGRAIGIADLDDDHVAISCEIVDVERTVPRGCTFVRTFVLWRKPNNDGWYSVMVAEIARDKLSPALIAQLCKTDDEQDNLLDRLGIIIDGYAVEPQYV
jgi:hypothetical protein